MCSSRRAGSFPTVVSPLATSHTDPVYQLVWLTTKTASEFFTAAADMVKWWDVRKMDRPQDHLALDRRDYGCPDRTHAPSCLEFEATMPGK